MSSISQLLAFISGRAIPNIPFNLPEGRQTCLPEYALQYAPHTYLHSTETYWPSDIKTHLSNVIPEVNFTRLASTAGAVNLDNLNNFNSSVYLTAGSNPTSESVLKWIRSEYGRPDNRTGISDAPGTIIAVTKNETVTDVFYFTFFSYNYGGKVLGINFGNHIGDWEHIMIRFNNSKPYAIYCSQHSSGSAYHWNAVSFSGERPIAFIANGSHSNYVTAGSHKYSSLSKDIADTTDVGYFWDITKNYRGYTYDVGSRTFNTACGAGSGAKEEGEEGETASWLSWGGKWGDQQYPESYQGQYCVLSQCRFSSGPTGPIAKNLERNAVCQNEQNCSVFGTRNSLVIQ